MTLENRYKLTKNHAKSLKALKTFYNNEKFSKIIKNNEKMLKN